MRNKKRKSVGRVLIDLTPLLDVVFILLFVVLAGTSKLNEGIQVLQKQTEEKMEEANDLAESARTREEALNVADSVLQFVNIVEINELVEEDRSRRTLYVKTLSEDGIEGESKKYELNKNNSADQLALLKADVMQLVQGDKPVLLNIEYPNMLYRDEKSIIELFREEENFFIKPYRGNGNSEE